MGRSWFYITLCRDTPDELTDFLRVDVAAGETVRSDLSKEHTVSTAPTSGLSYSVDVGAVENMSVDIDMNLEVIPHG